MNLCNPSEIKDLLERHSFRFSKSLGQNFLIESWVPERIAASSGADEGSGILEIGPGIGCLTSQLSKRAASVCAVELDPDLPDILAESLADCPNVTIIPGDIMKTDLQALVEERFAGLTPRVCANLPYNITTPVLSRLLESGLFESVTVMIQREVAHRLCAKPGTADYGAFSLFVQYYSDPVCLFDVSPGCFMPAPKVTSTVVRMDKRACPPAEVKNPKLFFRVVKAAFAQRRKTLVNGLSADFPLGKTELAELLEQCGLDARVRGETLGIPEFGRLAEALEGRLGGKA